MQSLRSAGPHNPGQNGDEATIRVQRRNEFDSSRHWRVYRVSWSVRQEMEARNRKADNSPEDWSNMENVEISPLMN